MYNYKWSWLVVVELSICDHIVSILYYIVYLKTPYLPRKKTESDHNGVSKGERIWSQCWGCVHCLRPKTTQFRLVWNVTVFVRGMFWAYDINKRQVVGWGFANGWCIRIRYSHYTRICTGSYNLVDSFCVLNVCCVSVFYVFLCCSVCWFLYGPFVL